MKRPGGFTPAPRSEAHDAPEREKPRQSAPLPLLSRFARRPVESAPPDAPPSDADVAPETDGAEQEPSERQKRSLSLRQAIRARRRLERSEVKRFTARSRRRKRNALIAIGAVVLVAVGSVAAAYSPLMAVRTVTVEGAKLVNSDGIVNDLQSQIGRPFPLIDQREIKAQLVKYPLIQSYTVEAVPPSTLVVRLIEREPLGLRATKGGFALVDAAGVVLRTDADRIAGYPVIDVDDGPSSTGFAAAVSVLRALPDDVRTSVDTVSASTFDDVTLTLSDSGATVRWGSADDSAVKARALSELMKSYPPAEVKLYDVSSSKNVIVQPR